MSRPSNRTPGRREFLRRLADTSATVGLVGFGVIDDVLAALDPPATAAHFERIVPFTGEGSPPLGRPFGAGLAGRQLLDLSRLEAHSLVTTNESFFIRTRYPRTLDPKAPWPVVLHGASTPAQSLSADRLAADAQPMGVHLIECAGNGARRRFGLISAARWQGVPLASLLARMGGTPPGALVKITGFDEHLDHDPGSLAGASWIFHPRQLLEQGAFLATGMNEGPLPLDHGYPVRLIVPGWYGCVCVKWVQRVELVEGAAPPTGQMREYAGRTHQQGVPARARDFRPAALDVAALPVRVELWSVGGKPLYRIVGLVWGGQRAPRSLEIRCHHSEPYRPVERYTPHRPSGWALWNTRWRPERPGHHRIRLRVPDPGLPARRLDAGYYDRAVIVTAV